MFKLILESSSSQTLIAIFEKDRLLLSKKLAGSNQMLLELQQSLKELNCKTDAFDSIIIGTGPGSFVGLRVSASIAKMLSYSHKIPLLGICSLMGFVPETDGSFLAISDAKMRGVYLLEGKKRNGIVSYHSKVQACSLEELKNKSEGTPLLVGTNLYPIKKAFEVNHPNTFPNWEEVSFDPSRFVDLAQKSLENREYSLDGSLELLYL